MEKQSNYGYQRNDEHKIISAIKSKLVKNYGYSVSLIQENFPLEKGNYHADMIIFESSKKDKISVIVEAKSGDLVLPLGLTQLEKYMKLSMAKYGILTNGADYIFLENIDGEFIQSADIPRTKKSDEKILLTPIPNPSNLIWQFFDQSRIFGNSSQKFDYELLKIIVSKYVDENDPKSENYMKKFLTNNDHENHLLLQNMWAFVRRKYPILDEEEIRIEPKLATLLIHSLKDFTISKSNLQEIISSIISYGSKHPSAYQDPNPEIINLMLESIKINRNDSILIPYCGHGNILSAIKKYLLKNKTISKSNIVFVENNRILVNQTNMIMILFGLQPCVIFQDPMHYECEERFDKILCFNIPFTRKIPHNPSEIRTDYADIIFKLSKNVKKGGKIVTLLPSNFLFSLDKNKQRLREILLQQFYLHAIIKLPRGVFHSYSMLETVIIVLEKKSTTPEITVKNGNYDIFFGKIDGQYSRNITTNESQITQLLAEYRTFRIKNTLKNPSHFGFLSSPDKLDEHWNLKFDLELKEKISLIKNPVKLSEVTEIITGRPILQKSVHGNEIPYLGISDLQDQLIRDEISKKILLSDSVLKKYSTKRILQNDIVISCQATIGKTAIVTSKHKGALLGPRLIALRPSRKILPEYLLHTLSLESTQEQLSHLATGSFIPSLSAKSLKNLVIPLPNILEQEKIVKKSMKIIDKIQSLEEELRFLKSNLLKITVRE